MTYSLGRSLTNSISQLSVGEGTLPPDATFGGSIVGADVRFTANQVAALLAPMVSALLTGNSAYAGTLSAAQPTATRIYQRDTRTGSAFGKGAGTVGLSVTLSAAAATLDYRLRDADSSGNPVLQDWTGLAGAMAAGSASLSPAIPAGPHRYLMDVRANGDTAHAVLGTQPFGVGEVVAVAGQSLAYNALVSGLNPEGSIASAGVTSPANGYQFTPNLPDGSAQVHQAWATVADGTPADSAFAAEFLRLVTSQAGVVAALAGHAVGSTSITTWQPGQANYTALRGVLDQVGRIGALIWIQGHSDAQGGMGAATYQGQLAALFTDLAGHYAGPGGTLGAFPRLICSIPSLDTAYWGTPAQAAAIRAGALAYVASDPRARYVAALDMGLSSDGTHPNQAGRVPMARDFYRAFMGVAGLVSEKPGPAITGATRAAGSAVVKLAVAQGAGGTSLVAMGTPANQFTVYPAGSLSGALAIASLSIASATEIDLTLAAAPADGQALDVWYRLAGSDTAAVTGSGIYDNAVDADGLTTGRQLQLAAAAITAAAPGQAAPVPTPAAFTVRSAPQGPVPSAVTVPASGTGGVNCSIQVFAPDGTNSNTVAFAISSSGTTPPSYGSGDDGVNAGDFQDFSAALGGVSPPTFACNFKIYPNGNGAGTSRTVYLWAFNKDGGGNYLAPVRLTNPDGTPFPITVSYQ